MVTSFPGAMRMLSRRTIFLFAALAGIYALLAAGEAWFLDAIRTSWTRMQGEIDSTLAENIRTQFDRRVRTMADVADEFASTDALRRLLTAGESGPAAADAALALLRIDLPPTFAIECFSDSGSLRFSIGRPLPPPRDSDRDRWHLARDAIHTLLIREMTIPAAGTLRIATPFTASVPVNTRFFSGQGIKEEIEEESGVSFDVETDLQSPARLDGRLLAVPLTAGRDTLALALLPRTNPRAHAQRIAGEFARARSFLLAVFFVAVLFLVRKRAARMPADLSRAALVLAVLWGCRAAMLALNVGQGLLPESVLHPAAYASSFGFGLASSPGELFLTLLALIASAATLHRAARRARAGEPASVVIARAQLIFAMLLLPLLLRGLGASIRSFVLDSSFNYDDIVPFGGQPLFVFMLANVFLLTTACLLGFATLYHIARRAAPRAAATSGGGIVLALGAGIVSLALFALRTVEFLVPFWWYLAAMAAFLGSIGLRPATRRGFGIAARYAGLWIAVTLVSALLLGQFMREKRAQDIEAIAGELVRPADGWTKVLCEQALLRIAADTLPVPPSGRPPSTPDYGLCFALWAKSALSTQPNNTAVLAFDSVRTPVSRFAVGIDPKILADRDILDKLAAIPGRTERLNIRTAASRRLFYGGLTETRSRSGGRVWIAVLVEGLDPMHVTKNEIDILRNTPRRPSLAPEDQLVYRVFRRGRMIDCSDPGRIAATLPDSIWIMQPAGTEGFWSAVEEDGRSSAAFVAQAGRGEASYLALSTGDSDPLFLIFRVLRLGWLYLFFSLLTGIPFIRVSAFRPPRRPVPFSRVVQLAFLAVAAVPVVLIWLTARSYVVDNARRGAERQLTERLDAAEQRIVASLDSLRPESVRRGITDSLCFEIADAAQSVLNVYIGHDLHATSKPELYHTGLLNTRLEASAFTRIVLRGASFAATEERIGDFSYAVGYRAIRSRGGRTLAVLSIPTLFESGRAEQEYIRASAIVLIGTAAVVLVVILLSGALSRQISRPLRELTAATDTIASGDLSRKVTVRGSAEVQDLATSFNSMTEQLRHSREELSAAERELAWKEMAKQVAHEIRNPLTPIKLAAQHLQRAAQDGAGQLRETVLAMTRTIIEQIDTLARISEEFAHFARLPRRSLSDVDAAEVLREAMDLHRVHENIRFTLRAPDAVSPVRADRQELARAFNNILRNAVQAIQGNGEIVADVAEDSGTVVITIRDTGIGIAAGLLPHIFEPNFSTKTEGMGLGLAIVKKIIDDVGGRISIESTPGEGSRVRLELPAMGGDRPAEHRLSTSSG